MGTALTLCGCPNDARHIDPEPDWIGNAPITHGESERDVPDTDTHVHGAFDAYCLCGHPNYSTCPEAFGDGSVLGYGVERADAGDEQ